VEISSKPTSGMSCMSGVCTPTAKSAVLNVTDLQDMLASGSVKVTTSVLTNDIKVQAALTWASANALTLDARRAIVVNRPVSVAGTAGLTLTTNDGSTKGDLTFGPGGNINFFGTSNPLTINGKGYMLENSISALASAIASKPNGHYALSASYNAGNDGTYKNSPIATKFDGSFEGLGNSISNLSVSGTYDNEGLFASIGRSGVVRDLNLINESVTGNEKSSVGGVAGTNHGLLQGDNASGQFTLQNAVLRKLVQPRVGAIVAYNTGIVRSSTSTGTVMCAVPCTAGGAVAQSDGLLHGLQSSTTVTVVGGSDAGGLVGVATVIENSEATGSVTGTGSNVGGLVGIAGEVKNSFATGSVAGGSGAAVGGLVGDAGNGLISNCYSEGTVFGGSDATVGGLIGSLSGNGEADDSYSTGDVSGGTGAVVGGFVGLDGSGGTALTDTFWDLTTSGISSPSQGAGNVSNDPGITGLTTAQLQSGLPAGFSSSIWGEKSTINDGLPYLLAIPPSH